MAVLLVSGSTRSNSSNIKLLDSFRYNIPKLDFQRFDLNQLPLFDPNLIDGEVAQLVSVVEWRKAIGNANVVVISTPAYLYNIPAVLKNGLEWLANSGELQDKPVFAITYTPHAPRGQKAMESLLNSLKALKSNILGSCALYQDELKIAENGQWEGAGESFELIQLLSDILEPYR